MTVIFASEKTGDLFSFSLEEKVRADYAEPGNPDSRYDRVYFQVNVYDEHGLRINFGFVDNDNDLEAIEKVVRDVICWAETPTDVLDSMHSRFD